jgi:hypothetical protein
VKTAEPGTGMHLRNRRKPRFNDRHLAGSICRQSSLCENSSRVCVETAYILLIQGNELVEDLHAACDAWFKWFDRAAVTINGTELVQRIADLLAKLAWSANQRSYFETM